MGAGDIKNMTMSLRQGGTFATICKVIAVMDSCGPSDDCAMFQSENAFCPVYKKNVAGKHCNCFVSSVLSRFHQNASQRAKFRL